MAGIKGRKAKVQGSSPVLEEVKRYQWNPSDPGSFTNNAKGGERNS